MGGLDNDTRGWIMAGVSGVACTFGASIICVDLVVRLIPGKKNFRIEESNPFLSSGMSLSFGVMIFSSLYSMLPSARNYLQKGALSARAATFTLVGCFLVGALGIAVLSQILHRYIPHSVVDCDHEHGDEEEGKKIDAEEGGANEAHESTKRQMNGQRREVSQVDGVQEESVTPSYGTNSDTFNPRAPARRPTLHAQINKVSQLVTGQKDFCDEHGQCHGYSDPCGQECFRNVQHTRPPRLHSSLSKSLLRPSAGGRTQTTPHERQPLLQNADESTALTPTVSGPATMESSVASLPSINGHSPNPNSVHKKPSSHSLASHSGSTTSATPSQQTQQLQQQHHHHVPTNAFLSIGLQTSIAIALHKVPEGFITYATNHANPRLGFSIFLALFIHNITEGFAMALPLYLAIHSRWKAMFWSALLGGVSQPLGAGIAALWFGIARRAGGGNPDGGDDGDKGGEPGDRVYGVMFAITAGVMAMVSLQLLGESLELTHSRRLCFVSAFCGMAVLGLSSALTA